MSMLHTHTYLYKYSCYKILIPLALHCILGNKLSTATACNVLFISKLFLSKLFILLILHFRSSIANCCCCCRCCLLSASVGVTVAFVMRSSYLVYKNKIISLRITAFTN